MTSTPGVPDPAAAGDDVERIEAQVALLFHHVRTRRRLAAARVHPDLQAAAYVILIHLVNHGAARASELVEYFGIDKAAVSRHVSHLEALGLATRCVDPDDGRAQLVSASAEGRRRCRREQQRRHRLLQERLSGWTPERTREFGDLLEEFNAATADLTPER